MNTYAIHTGQAALALALAARTSGPESAIDSAVARTGRLPFIGIGTFLVAAYLSSSLCPNSLANGNQADLRA
jgi:hypothetical protein